MTTTNQWHKVAGIDGLTCCTEREGETEFSGFRERKVEKMQNDSATISIPLRFFFLYFSRKISSVFFSFFSLVYPSLFQSAETLFSTNSRYFSSVLFYVFSANLCFLCFSPVFPTKNLFLFSLFFFFYFSVNSLLFVKSPLFSSPSLLFFFLLLWSPCNLLFIAARPNRSQC